MPPEKKLLEEDPEAQKETLCLWGKLSPLPDSVSHAKLIFWRSRLYADRDLPAFVLSNPS